MESEFFNLSWSDFSASASKTFKNLLGDTIFADVTLVCEEDKQLLAHKVILGSCSKVFQNILVKNPHQSPLIYLTDVKFDQLKLLIDFIYTGETEVAKVDLGSFMKIANKLEIQGLMEHATEDSTCDDTVAYQPAINQADNLQKQKAKKIKVKQEIEPNQENETDVNDKCSELPAENLYSCVQCDSTFNEADSLSVHVKSLHNKPRLNPQIEVKFIEEDVSPMEDENQEKSFDEISVAMIESTISVENIQCKHCYKTFTQSGTLNRHVRALHEGVRLQCVQCEYSSTYQYILKQHVEKFHLETT